MALATNRSTPSIGSEQPQRLAQLSLPAELSDNFGLTPFAGVAGILALSYDGWTKIFSAVGMVSEEVETSLAQRGISRQRLAEMTSAQFRQLQQRLSAQGKNSVSAQEFAGAVKAVLGSDSSAAIAKPDPFNPAILLAQAALPDILKLSQVIETQIQTFGLNGWQQAVDTIAIHVAEGKVFQPQELQTFGTNLRAVAVNTVLPELRQQYVEIFKRLNQAVQINLANLNVYQAFSNFQPQAYANSGENFKQGWHTLDQLYGWAVLQKTQPLGSTVQLQLLLEGARHKMLHVRTVALSNAANQASTWDQQQYVRDNAKSLVTFLSQKNWLAGVTPTVRDRLELLASNQWGIKPAEVATAPLTPAVPGHPYQAKADTLRLQWEALLKSVATTAAAAPAGGPQLEPPDQKKLQAWFAAFFATVNELAQAMVGPAMSSEKTKTPTEQLQSIATNTLSMMVFPGTKPGMMTAIIANGGQTGFENWLSQHLEIAAGARDAVDPYEAVFAGLMGGAVGGTFHISGQVMRNLLDAFGKRPVPVGYRLVQDGNNGGYELSKTDKPEPMRMQAGSEMNDKKNPFAELAKKYGFELDDWEYTAKAETSLRYLLANGPRIFNLKSEIKIPGINKFKNPFSALYTSQAEVDAAIAKLLGAPDKATSELAINVYKVDSNDSSYYLLSVRAGEKKDASGQLIDVLAVSRWATQNSMSVNYISNFHSHYSIHGYKDYIFPSGLRPHELMRERGDLSSDLRLQYSQLKLGVSLENITFGIFSQDQLSGQGAIKLYYNLPKEQGAKELHEELLRAAKNYQKTKSRKDWKIFLSILDGIDVQIQRFRSDGSPVRPPEKVNFSSHLQSEKDRNDFIKNITITYGAAAIITIITVIYNLIHKKPEIQKNIEESEEKR